MSRPANSQSSLYSGLKSMKQCFHNIPGEQNQQSSTFEGCTAVWASMLHDLVRPQPTPNHIVPPPTSPPNTPHLARPGRDYLGEAHVGSHALAAAVHIPHLDLAIQASRQQQVASLGKEPTQGHVSQNEAHFHRHRRRHRGGMVVCKQANEMVCNEARLQAATPVQTSCATLLPVKHISFYRR